MSNYTSAPSFDGPSGYAQPWSSSDPSRPGMLPQNYPGSHNETNNMSSFQANSQLPGLGVGAPGPLPPPSFPFIGSLTPSQFAPPFSQIQMPFLGYPPMPMPTAPNQQQQAPAASADVQSHSVSKPTSQYDHEEGEVTDRERTESTPHGNQQHAQGTYISTGMNNYNGSTIPTPVQSEMASGRHQDTGISEAEEGEASSVSRASSRASGSPYNPPMSVTADSPLPEEASVPGLNGQPGQPGQVSASLGTQKPQGHASSETTRAQLRIQAQGALLRLAPHNIRFHDLVGEGINPVVLRQLYEEVGIKVFSPETGAPVDNAQSRTAESGTNSAGESPVLEGRPHSAPQSAITKPMERKEVIARMLAAKAAKASASPHESVKDPSAAPTPRSYNVDGAMSPELPAKEKEAPIKEKNKAQTELARKRIDELKKKQDLMRSQQNSQADYVSQAPQSPPNNPPIRVEHPLPERPPLSEATPARLPGLSVGGSSSNAAPEINANSVQGLALDSTPQSRVTQRKRPRASDFDEPTDISEDSSQRAAAKLVIDLSDDEFYGDDENDNMDIETPALRTTSSADLPGMTQQNARGGDQDHIRKKDQEIQAMRQKIAELEQRKKARLAASNTQSPFAQATLSLDGDSVAMDARPSIVSPTPPVITENYNIDGSGSGISQNQRATPSSPKDLSSMDSGQLEAIRLRFLRKREIESGLPDLDSEIENTAAKLSKLQKDEETLLLNITKGRQGRQRLLGELGDLGLELNGLTLEQIEAARQKLKSRDSSLPLDKDSIIPSSANPTNDFSVAHTVASSENPVLENTKSPEEAAPPVIAEHESSLSDAAGENCAGLNMEEAPEPYASDSAGSAMDESSGSSSTDSTSDSEASSEDSDEGPSEEPEVAMDERADGNANTEHHPSTLPEGEPQSSIEAESGKEPVSGVQEDEHQVSRASSAASEAYEPPEPEPDSGSAVSEYVPAGPGNEEPDMTEPFPSQPQNDESLTGNVQEIGVNFGGSAQNAPEVPINEHKFSPYISPLRDFKSYRYHPNYSDDVSGGYRSLTYSHNIDAMKYLCPFEVAGGVCNDQSCDSQHFGSMALSDDKILVQMGSLREGKTPEEKDQYITGLKQIINDMRRDKVKEFNTVATEIAAYRRRFLQDPSRVLPL